MLPSNFFYFIYQVVVSIEITYPASAADTGNWWRDSSLCPWPAICARPRQCLCPGHGGHWHCSTSWRGGPWWERGQCRTGARGRRGQRWWRCGGHIGYSYCIDTTPATATHQASSLAATTDGQLGLLLPMPHAAVSCPGVLYWLVNVTAVSSGSPHHWIKWL